MLCDLHTETWQGARVGLSLFIQDYVIKLPLMLIPTVTGAQVCVITAIPQN